MLVIFDMLISLFERAYLVAWKPKMSAPNSGAGTRGTTTCASGAGATTSSTLLPQLLRGEDPQFQGYIQRVAQDERGLSGGAAVD